VLDAETEPKPSLEDEGSPTDGCASSAPVVSEASVPADRRVERSWRARPPVLLTVPLQPPRSVAPSIDGDNQSPAIARDRLASVRKDWGLNVACAVRAGNDHDHTVPPWLKALADVSAAM